MGLSFSIPIDAAMDIYEQLKSSGEVTRAYLGIYPQDIDRNLAEVYGHKARSWPAYRQTHPRKKQGLKKAILSCSTTISKSCAHQSC